MQKYLDQVKQTVRGIMHEIAKLLDLLTNGSIRPNHITYISLLGHIILGLAVATNRFPEAAMLLVVFGLLDTVDGELARFQGTSSISGALLDATTDRLKETIVYASLAFYFSTKSDDIGVLYSVLALGISFAVSYVKAKGEVALLSKPKKVKTDINRIFAGGLFGYEVRMFVLVVGLLFSEPRIAVAVVIAGGMLTFIQRSIQINHALLKNND